MRFSVDAHAIGQHLTGNETYVRNLLNCFAVLDQEADFVTYLSRDDAFVDVPPRFLKRRVAVNPFVRLGFDLPRKLRQDRPDLVHVQYTAPVFCCAPIVVSVHDVSFLEHPDFFTPFRALQLRYTVHRTVKSAARIITASEFSKRRILNFYQLDEAKVVVLPNGVASAFRPMPRGSSQRWVDTTFGLRSPFILTVGDLQPRKNHIGLIRAFEKLLCAHPHFPHQLVIVGKENWSASTVRATAKRSSVVDRIHFTGFVSDEGLLRLYGACDLFVYPSLYEGFGLPILEAMACGRAVACSNTSAIPEVADSAALLFDPNSDDEIALALRDLLLNPELRQRMERLGMQRAAMFSWEKTASKTLDLYYAVAGETSRRTTPALKAISAGH